MCIIENIKVEHSKVKQVFTKQMMEPLLLSIRYYYYIFLLFANNKIWWNKDIM